MPVFGLSLTKSFLARIKKVAEFQGQTMADFIRKAVLPEVEKIEKKMGSEKKDLTSGIEDSKSKESVRKRNDMDMMDMFELTPQKILEKRAILGISQVALAKAVGMRPASICKIETGKSKPSVITLAKLAKFFEQEEAKRKEPA